MLAVDFSKDYYGILGVDEKASSDDIKKAYRVLAKKYHPDINKSKNSEELFKAISEAYEVLSDERLRVDYDAIRELEFSSRKSYKEEGTDNPEKSDSGSDQSADMNEGDGKSYTYGEQGQTYEAGPDESYDGSGKDKDREQYERIFVCSLVAPGFFQIYSGQKKFGYLLFVVYFMFWILAFMQNLFIGILAILVWAYAIYDAHSALEKINNMGIKT